MNSYKIEFYSTRRYQLYDTIRLRLHGGAFTTQITGITYNSGDDRYLYRCGELATTIQQKVKKSLSASSARASLGGAGMSLQSVYPVGAIYISTADTNPSTLFGFGTWAQIKDVFLLAAGDTYAGGSAGGEATHTLINSEIPSHNHAIWYPNESAGNDSAQIGYPSVASKSTYYAVGSNTGDVGGGQAHNNMPPYLAVYMWRRTA